jgi:hypothetical protein
LADRGDDDTAGILRILDEARHEEITELYRSQIAKKRLGNYSRGRTLRSTRLKRW